MRQVFLLKNLTFIFLFLMILLASGCTPLYNNNGWSVWGWSREKNNSTVHAGFVSTDFFFGNAGDNTQTTKEKVKIEKQLQDELGFGTIGIYTGKEF